MAGKSQIADRIAARGATRTAAVAAVDAVLDEITAALAAGERVTLTGFGTFEAADRAARTARNPRTGEPLEVPATTVARFHPGATLRARVAGAAGETPDGVADLSSLHALGAAAQSMPAPVPTATPLATKAASTKAADGTKHGKKSKADGTKKADAKKGGTKKADAKKDGKKKADAKKDGKKKSSGKGRAKKK